MVDVNTSHKGHQWNECVGFERHWLHVHFWIHKKDNVTRIKCYSRLLTISLQEITQRMYTCVCITLKVCVHIHVG